MVHGSDNTDNSRATGTQHEVAGYSQQDSFLLNHFLIMSEYKFQSTVDPKKLAQLYAISGTEWGAPYTAQDYGKKEANYLVKWILSGNAGRGFYLEAKDGTMVCSTVVTHHKGFSKDPERRGIAGVPDPTAFGVKPITGLRVEHVFTHKEYRGKGLMNRLVLKAIEYTEDDILKKELAKSPDTQDSLKLMVTTNGSVDKTLASYYLGKKYFWYLYSAIGEGYRRFGFKAYPLDGYVVPFSMQNTHTYKMVEQALQGEATHVEVGKKIRFLDGTNKLDRDLIEYIFQGKELDLMTELSKANFHSELSGDQRSSSSLTNIATILSQTKLGSTNELSAIAEKLEDTSIGGDGESGGAAGISTPSRPNRRKLSIHVFGVPRVGLKPDFANLEKYYKEEEDIAAVAGNSENVDFTNLKGAILTNELQQKSFYILWATIMHKKFVIMSMGELKLDLFGAIADPSGFTNPLGRRRGSSFSGLNEMGGVNFQDMALLINTAVFVANHRNGLEPGVLVSINDLPQSVPTAVLHDFFMNYLGQDKFEGGDDEVDGSTSQEKDKAHAVTYVKSFGEGHDILPSLKRFGSTSADFELDWTANSFSSWG